MSEIKITLIKTPPFIKTPNNIGRGLLSPLMWIIDGPIQPDFVRSGTTSQDEDEDEVKFKRNQSKMGNYDDSENGCPNCGRYRVMIGADGKHRCEKCAWCIEDKDYDSEFQDYLS